MAAELSKMGVPVQELQDGLIIRPGQRARGAGRGRGQGRGARGLKHGHGKVRKAEGTADLPRGAELDGHGDHRIVMACSLAGLRSRGSVTVRGAEAAAVTFPRFFTQLNDCARNNSRNNSIKFCKMQKFLV